MKRFSLFLGMSLLVVGLCPRISQACSVCRCGDNAFLFSEKEAGLPDQALDHRFWFSVSNLYSSKANALDGEEGPGTERQYEFRPSVRLFYNPSDRFSFSIEAPYQFRRIKFATPDGVSQERASGLGDMEVSAIWTKNLVIGDGEFYAGGLSLTIKLPTGANDMIADGERVDEHLQAGTGALDWQVGTAVSRLTSRSRVFASVYYRHNGTNDHSYHYGNAVLLNFGSQWPLSEWLSGSLQINSRYAKHDLEGSEFVANTGGWVTYLAPGFRVRVAQAASVSTSLQIPIHNDLYGDQSEKAVLSTGLSFEF